MSVIDGIHEAINQYQADKFPLIQKAKQRILEFPGFLDIYKCMTEKHRGVVSASDDYIFIEHILEMSQGAAYLIRLSASESAYGDGNEINDEILSDVLYSWVIRNGGKVKSFKMWYGSADCDGQITIQCKNIERTFPIEVGTCDPGRLASHFHSRSGWIRFPYEIPSVFVFIRKPGREQTYLEELYA